MLAADPDGELQMAYCLSNVESETSRFTVDPAEHFGAMRHAESRGWEITGSFHSHPHSEATPSGADVAGALDPEWVYLIAGPITDVVPVRAFRIRSGVVAEIGIEVAA